MFAAAIDEGIWEVRGGAQEFSLLVRDVLGGSGLLHDVFILEREMPRARMTLGYASYLGLYAEEIGLHGERLGNFPQAFRHLGLISAAYYLDQAIDQQGQQT